MVSLDEPERNREFAESLGAKLVLLSDPTGINANAYGVAAPGGGYARRWTFYIDRDGVIREIDRDVSVETAGQDIARKLKQHGFPSRESRVRAPAGAPDSKDLPGRPRAESEASAE